MSRHEWTQSPVLLTLLGICCFTAVASGQQKNDRLAPAVPSWQWQERNPGPPQGPTTGSEENRAVFVPFWTGKLEAGSTRRQPTGPTLADAFWPEVALGSQEVAPIRGRSPGSVLLRSFQRSTLPRRPGEAHTLVAVVRVRLDAEGAAPVLEVAESQTAIQSSARGRLLRRSQGWAEYQFIVREPIPLARPPLNPALRGQLTLQDADRHFDLQLTQALSPGRQSRR